MAEADAALRRGQLGCARDRRTSTRGRTTSTSIKRRYSGFFNTDLDLTLKDLGGRLRSWSCGVVTNICVRATVHDAFFLGYQVVVPEDCVAATGPREQASSLYDIATHFGTVCSGEQVIAALLEGAPLTNRELAA